MIIEIDRIEKKYSDEIKFLREKMNEDYKEIIKFIK